MGHTCRLSSDTLFPSAEVRALGEWSLRFVFRKAGMQEVWEVILALLVPADRQVRQLPELDSLALAMKARSRSPQDAPMTSPIINWVGQHWLWNEFARMQHAQSEWQNQFGGEMNEFLRRQCNTNQNAAKVSQHTRDVRHPRRPHQTDDG